MITNVPDTFIQTFFNCYNFLFPLRLKLFMINLTRKFVELKPLGTTVIRANVIRIKVAAVDAEQS
jgi:hypothetical protein